MSFVMKWVFPVILVGDDSAIMSVNTIKHLDADHLNWLILSPKYI